MHIWASFCTTNEEFFYKCRSKYCAFRFIYYVELPTTCKSIFLAFPFNYVPCGFVIFSPDLIGIFIPPANEVGGGGYIGITPSVCPSVCLSRVNLTLVITFQPLKIRLSYYTCWFLVIRPFYPYQKIWPCDLDLDFWHTFEKNLTLAITFEPREIRFS